MIGASRLPFLSFSPFTSPGSVHYVHSSSRTKGQRTGVKWGEWWTRGMNGSEPRDERNMGSIDSWIPFVSLRHPRSLSLISLPVGDGSEDERSEPSASRSLRSRYAEGMEGNGRKEGTEHDEPTKRRGNGPDCYQRLEFFIQVLRVLCPNLTDASHPPFTPFPSRIVRFHTFTSQYAPQAGVTGGNATRRERRERSGNNMRRKPAVS